LYLEYIWKESRKKERETVKRRKERVKKIQLGLGGLVSFRFFNQVERGKKE